MMIRELQRQEAVEIPERHSITPIYQKFLETSLVEDCVRSGRPSTIRDDIINEVEEASNRKAQSTEKN